VTKPRKKMRIRLRGKRWRLVFKRLAGDCGRCRYRDNKLHVSDDVRGRLRLDTLIHEMLHACYPDVDEDSVTETATDMARGLWRLGYRAK
jgi:hypothetical protein